MSASIQQKTTLNPDVILKVADQPEESGTETLLSSSYKVSNKNGIGLATNDISKSCLENLLKTPDGLFDAKDSKTIKMGRTAQVTCCKIQSDSETLKIAYKRICRKNIFKAVTGLFQQNRAIRAFQTGQLFLQKGIPTPKPVAAIIPKSFSWKQKGYLAVLWLDHSQQLDQLCQKLSTTPENHRKEQLKQLATQLGHVIGQMHSENICHNDLKAANILVDNSSGKMNCYLIDLDGVEVSQSIKDQTRFKNLARLNITSRKQKVISLSDRCRFLKSYCSIQPGDHWNWKHCWNKIEELNR